MSSSEEKSYSEEEDRDAPSSPEKQGPTWVRGDLLGKGGYSRVYSMQNIETGEFFAGKFSGTELPPVGENIEGLPLYKKLKKAKKVLRSEIFIHKQVSHPNIVSYISSFSTNSCYEEKDIVVEPDYSGECEVLVIEICPNKSLYDLLKTRKNLTEDEARFYIFHVAKALAYLRDKHILHRDIKLGNIFLDAHLNPKIGDFGLATMTAPTKEFVGTPNYVAPEVLKEEQYSFPVDTWALGVCLYTLIFGRPPFEKDDIKLTYRLIKDGIYSWPFAVSCSENAKNLIREMLNIDPNKRISIYDVLKAPFLKEDLIMKTMPLEARVEIPKILRNPETNVLSSGTSVRERKTVIDEIYNNIVVGTDETRPLEHVPSESAPKPLVWIQKYIVSKNTGLAYQTNTGTFGMYFNDGVILIRDSDGKSSKFVGDISLAVKEKRNSILDTFIQQIPKWTTAITADLNPPKSVHTKPLIYVRKWVMTNKGAVFFRLSDDTIQVAFADNTGFIITQDIFRKSILTVVTENQMTTFWLSEVRSREDKKFILPRLYYVRDLLKSFIDQRRV